MPQDALRVIDRTERLLASRLTPAIARARVPATLAAWEVPDEPVPFPDALAAAYTAVAAGLDWGRPWGTTWFRVRAEVPAGWAADPADVELHVDLGFRPTAPGFQAEALAYRPDGTILKAVEPRNTHVRLHAAPGDHVEVYLEAASNPDVAGDYSFAPTPFGSKETAPADPLYRLRAVDLVWRDRTVWELVQDVTTLLGLLRVLPADRPRRARVHDALARMLDAVDPDDVAGTAAAARAVLAPALSAPAVASAHRVVAVGHAHIDSAWLWPVRETVRKCARTFSNVLDLIEEHPGFVFAASSAQQYRWVQQHYPDLFARIVEAVRAGRFLPVGGMWVESDTNMPGSEALTRQLVAGKRFFAEELGVDTQEVWLPDSFGYSAAVPQIAAGAGARWFLTQKPSWNDTNVLPHHTFAWEGIDGTRVLTHLPPVDTYNSDLSAEDLDRAERQFADKDRADHSLVPFGFGDGGGGPTREMLAAADRAADLEGLPRVALGSPRQFFEIAEAELTDPAVWSGEMYLELHRGVYTSQARTKRGNRRSEHLLREAEYWSTVAAVRTGHPYPYAELRDAWETVLLHQFHDILPGSSIAWVHREAEQAYAEVAERLEEVIGRALAAVAGEGDVSLVASAASFDVAGATAFAVGRVEPAVAPEVVLEERADGTRVLDNGVLRVRVDADGLVDSVVHGPSGREVVPDGLHAGLLQVFRDTPSKWDAWDLERHYRRVGTDLRTARSVTATRHAGGVTVEAVREHGASVLTQRLTLAPGADHLDLVVDADWHERDTLLKLAFPVAVHAERFASETQYGHVHRPISDNTSWDQARFEVCAHRWVHVEEPGFGVGVANDSTYGHDVTRVRTAAGRTATVLRLSLLRAPQYPDPDADQGRHVLACSLVVGAGTLDMVAHGQRLNLPARFLRGARAVAPLVASDDPAAVVEAVKLAEDGSGDVVVRLYEAVGASRRATLTTAFAWSGAAAVDLLERPVDLPLEVADGAITIDLHPFQIRTLRFGVPTEAR